MDCFSLAGKTAIITGGSSGLGSAIALAMAQAGANIVIADLQEPTKTEVYASLHEIDVKYRFIQTDVTNQIEIERLVSTAVKEFGVIDILVTSAGVGNKTPAEQLSAEEWDKVVNVNLRGVFWCCQKVGQQMIRQQSGSIINISSMSGSKVNKDRTISAYCVSKSGVIMLSKNLAVEWAKHNIRVNSIAPGYFVTPFNSVWMNNEEMTRTALDLTPMKRFGQPREIGPAAVFLASRAASFITGQNLGVDGGYMCW